ncbi:MAG: DUF481 domain-containing protein [Bacteroidetes bacterium]|nr:MAG: DUF481 domain-containing protein [Bacteroidota bacterium]
MTTHTQKSNAFRRRFLLALCLLQVFLLPAQVVNTEKLRVDAQEDGWAHQGTFGLSLSRNKAGQLLGIGLRLRSEYHAGRHRLLWVGDYARTRLQSDDAGSILVKNIRNEGFVHLRYNYRFQPWLTWEAFVQSQFNEIQAMRYRQLQGTGPRFRLIDRDSVHVFLGTLYMFEYEETTDGTPFMFHRDHRLSSYLSAGFAFSPTASLNHVTYFQPRLDQWSDFRLSSESILSVALTTHIQLNVSFNLVYDTQPPLGIPRTMYNLSNALALRW